MDKPFDAALNRMSKNQLIVLRLLLNNADRVVTAKEIAKKTGVVEKSLGGVLSAMSRKELAGLHLLVPMGKDNDHTLRYRLNSKAITVMLAIKQVRMLLASYK